MGCSCKKMEKIQKNLKEYDGNNTKILTEYVFEFCKNVINRIIIIFLFLIFAPIVLLVLLFNFIINGKFSFPITRLNKINTNDLKNELEKIS